MSDQFPRCNTLPSQTPLFWVKQKDRYLRQLLIRDIEEQTKRPLIVYFSDSMQGDPSASIDHSDEKHLAELLIGVTSDFDLMLETTGGVTDASEAILSLLAKAAKSYRVIVPLRAKSAGTTISLGSSEILMGVTSELGPIDPQMNLQGIGFVPATVVRDTSAGNPMFKILAEKAIEQTERIAKAALKRGGMAGTDDAEIAKIVTNLASSAHLPTHGAVVDSSEATNLGLKITTLKADDPLWQRIWLLRCMYEFDARATGCIKIFESSSASQSIKAPPPAKPTP